MHGALAIGQVLAYGRLVRELLERVHPPIDQVWFSLCVRARWQLMTALRIRHRGVEAFAHLCAHKPRGVGM